MFRSAHRLKPVTLERRSPREITSPVGWSSLRWVLGADGKLENAIAPFSSARQCWSRNSRSSPLPSFNYNLLNYEREFSNISSCQYVWSRQKSMLKARSTSMSIEGEENSLPVGLIKRRCTGRSRRKKKKNSERAFSGEWGLISKLLLTFTIARLELYSHSVSQSQTHHRHSSKLRQNMSIKISNNIGFCVHEEFFKLLERAKLEIIISNHVLFLRSAVEWRREKKVSADSWMRFLRCTRIALAASRALNGSTKNSFLRSKACGERWNITTSRGCGDGIKKK